MKGLLFYIFSLLSLFSFSQSQQFNIQNIPMNDDNPHFGLSISQNNHVFLTSYLLSKNGKVKRYMDTGILSIYKGVKAENGNIIKIEPLNIDSKEDITHITSACLSPDGNTLYVTTNYTNRKNRPKEDFKETNFHIESAEYIEGIGWTNFKALPFCKPRYSYAHPSISKDGKTMYFTSNIKGGKETTKGPSDIFKIEIQGNNDFGKPLNLGSKVNSYNAEMFPFISDDNVLYFASNRPNGIGGYDIYKSIMNKKGIFDNVNLMPEPINSKEDDFCFVLESNNLSGYFSSKRKEGKGEDDIYYFTIN